MPLTIFCYMCGNEMGIDLDAYKIKASTRFCDAIEPYLKDTGWRTQTNEESFDIYCSDECAK